MTLSGVVAVSTGLSLIARSPLFVHAGGVLPAVTPPQCNTSSRNGTVWERGKETTQGTPNYGALCLVSLGFPWRDAGVRPDALIFSRGVLPLANNSPGGKEGPLWGL